jgi:hypothetical protein
MQNTEAQNLGKSAIYIDGSEGTEEIDSYTLEGTKCLITFENNG